MEIINKARGAGKTHDIVQKVKNNKKALMVVFCLQEKDRIKNLYPEIKGRVMTWDELNSEKSLGYKYKEAHIDNMDMILSRLRFPIKTISMTRSD